MITHIMNDGYCGYGSWPECTDLATTGTDGDLLMWLVIGGLALVVFGVVSYVLGREGRR